MDVQVVDNDVGDILEGDTSAAGDVDYSTASVDSLEAVHQQLLIEPDGHIAREGYPEGAILDGAVAESAWLRVHRVAVRRVRHNIDRPALAAERVAAEPDATLSQPLPVLPPVTARAPPAVVDRVPPEALVLVAGCQERAPVGVRHLPEKKKRPKCNDHHNTSKKTMCIRAEM